MPRIQPLSNQQLPPETKEAFDRHVKDHNSRITNMKATMGRDVLAFEIYMHWYDLYNSVKSIVGERAAYLFAYSISEGSNCPLCTTYFRKAIIEHDESPEDLILSEQDQELLDFGSAIANNKGVVSDAVYGKIKARYSETDIVTLTCFAGQMVATNIFNNVLQVEIDEYLAPYISIKE